MSATSRSSSRVGGGPGRTRRARSRKTATDGARVGSAVSGSGSGSGASRKVYSGGGPSGSRLVASTDRCGHADRSAVTVSRAASSRCSQLSTTSNAGRSPRSATQAARTSPWTTCRLNAARACGIADGSVTGASSSTIGASLRCATSSATRVLPTPPAPTIVTHRCLHDMGDPLGAARRIRAALAPDGTWLVVEPNAADTVEGTLNPVGRLYYNGSLFLCLPNALSQPGGYALGAQAGEATVREIAVEAVFTRFRRAAETPFNLVYEIRP